MNEEEIAIKKLREMIILNQLIIMQQPDDEEGRRQLNDEIRAISFAVNFIENQQKELEHYKNINNHQSKDITKAVDYTAELNKELEKKEKIINKMASYIAQLDIDEDICSKTGKKDCDAMSLGECEDCMIQYFTKLTEEEK